MSKFQVTAIRPPAFNRLATESTEDELYELAQFSGLHSRMHTGEDAEPVAPWSGDDGADTEIYDIADQRSRASSRQNTEENTEEGEVDTYVLASAASCTTADVGIDVASQIRSSEATYLTPAEQAGRDSSLGSDNDFYPLAAPGAGPEDGGAGEEKMYQYAVAGGESRAVVQGRPSRNVRTITMGSTGSDQIYAMSTRTRTNDTDTDASESISVRHDSQGESATDAIPAVADI